MTYVLDSDTCIYFLEGRDEAVASRFHELTPDAVAITAISVAELRHGALKSQRPAANIARLESFFSILEILPFNRDAAAFYANVKDVLRRRGTPVGTMDLLIAATVLTTDATLVTNNVREFSRVPGLRVENWTSPTT